MTACTGTKPLRRSSAPTCQFPASTASSAPTATSTAPPRHPRCRRWPTGSNEFLPWYSSVHRGAGYKSRRATAAYEGARDSVHRFAAGRAAGAGTSSCWCATPPKPSTTWPTDWDSALTTSWPPPWSSTTPTSCRGRGWPRGAGSNAARTGTFDTADVVRVLEPTDGAPRAAGPDGSFQRDGLAAAGRGDLCRGARARRTRAARCGPAGAPPTADRRDQTSSPSAGTSCTRPSARAR